MTGLQKMFRDQEAERRRAFEEYRKKHPYGPGYAESEAQPGGSGEPWSLAYMNWYLNTERQKPRMSEDEEGELRNRPGSLPLEYQPSQPIPIEEISRRWGVPFIQKTGLAPSEVREELLRLTERYKADEAQRRLTMLDAAQMGQPPGNAYALPETPVSGPDADALAYGGRPTPPRPDHNNFVDRVRQNYRPAPAGPQPPVPAIMGRRG